MDYANWLAYVLFLLVLGALVVGYFLLCDLVGRAAEKKGRSSRSWFWIALLFGLAIPAIIVASMAPVPAGNSQDPKMACPYCGEEILQIAAKCKHCQSVIPDEYDPDDPTSKTFL